MLIEKVTRNNFKQFCNKKSQLCLFSIYEGDSDILRNGPANKELKKVRVELEGRSSPIKVGAIDGLCYFEISEKLGITKFPTLVVVNPKSNKFTMFEQKYNMQEILNFLDSAEELIYKQNKRFNVDFEKRDC